MQEPVVELAKTDYYPYESLTYGGKTQTLQAHPDLTGKIIDALARARTHPLAPGVSKEVYQKYLATPPSPEEIARIEENGRKIFRNWLQYYVIANMP